MSMRGPLSPDQDVFNALEHGEFLYQPTESMDDITPWREAMRRIFMGIALSAVTLGFVFPDLLLNTVSVVMLYLGFRSLRQENRWFCRGYRLTWVLMVGALARFAIGSTIWYTQITESLPGIIAGYVLDAVMLGTMVCVRQGIVAVQKKADVESDTRYLLIAMAVFVALTVLPLLPWSQAQEFAVLGGMVVFVWLLYKAYHNMGEAGYAIHPGTVKLSKVSVWLIAGGLAVVCIVTGLLFFHQYPMQWQEQQGVSSQAETVRQELIGLGMPQDIASDLSEEDLLELEGAEKVYAKIQDSPNDNVFTNYVSVLLPDGLKLLVHFRWNTDDVYRGTETFYFEYEQNDIGAQKIVDSCHGRLLYDKGSVSYASPYASIISGTYYKATGSHDVTYVPTNAFFAAFSMPAGGENCRGYLIYDVPYNGGGSPGNDGMYRLPVPSIMYIYQKQPMILDDCQGVVEFLSSTSRVIAPYFEVEKFAVSVPIEKIEH